jgi:CheY-like chemotaxis protein
VALTGYAGPDDVAKAKEAGFDAHLGKPASMAALENVLATCPSSETVHFGNPDR